MPPETDSDQFSLDLFYLILLDSNWFKPVLTGSF